MKLQTLIGLLIGFGLLSAASVLAQNYEIRLHRPGRVGNKEKISVAGKEAQEMSARSEGKVVQEEKREFTVDLDCVSTSLAVSPKGKDTRISLQIGKLVKTEAGVQKEVLAPGTVVVASKVGKRPIFEVDGKAVGREAAQVLEVVVSISTDDSTDDEMFGTRERKRVGDSWGINKAAMTESLNKDPKMTVKDIEGKATLMDVVKDASGQALHVGFEATAKIVPAGPLQSGTLVVKGSGEFPLDTSLARTRETMEMSMSVQGVQKLNPGGPEVEMRMTMKRSINRKITPAN